MNNTQNGKGSKPRSGFNYNYRRNFDDIDWGEKPELSTRAKVFEEICRAEFDKCVEREKEIDKN